jgi:hypothetical protein
MTGRAEQVRLFPYIKLLHTVMSAMGRKRKCDFEEQSTEQLDVLSEVLIEANTCAEVLSEYNRKIPAKFLRFRLQIFPFARFLEGT